MGFSSIMFDLKPVSNSYFGKDLKFSKNSEKLDDCLDRKDFETIIKDRDLFWLAYGKAVLHQDQKEIKSFFVSIEGKNISFSGEEHIIKRTQDAIEELRKFFIEGLESKKTAEILVIEVAQTGYFRKESSLINLCNTFDGYYKSLYHEYIKPALPKLAEFCGALYSEDKKNQLVKSTALPAQTEEVEVIRINWKEESHLIYQISPKSIPEQEEMGKALYSLYQKQQFCDFSLKSKDGVIKVHVSLLYLYGGPIIQKLLTSDMKEKTDQTVSFPDYSHSTVQAFIEFIYLGGRAFSEKAISSNNQNPINLFELFEFANTYQIETLIDCCTNLMSLLATKQDLEVLKHLVTLYDNKHLKQLYDHLSTKENAVIIKV